MDVNRFARPTREASRNTHRNPRISEDLVKWLKETFPPKCIQEGQSEIDAHRYAAKVELAQKLIAMAEVTKDPRSDGSHYYYGET